VTSAAGVVTIGVSGAVTVGVVLGSTCSCVLDGDDVGDDDVGAGVGSASVAWPVSFVDVLAPPELLTCISGAESAAWAGCEMDPVDVVDAAGWFVCVVDDVLVSAGCSVAAWWLSLGWPVDVEVDAESAGESDDLVSDGSDPVSACAWGSPRPWPVATAAPTPSATASAPTRPTYLLQPDTVTTIGAIGAKFGRC
jgi:hypothetical protein